MSSKIFTSPKVRKFARELGADIEKIKGSERKGRIIEDGWINNEWIKQHINNPDLDVKYINKFLGLLAFEIWYRLFITNEISSEDTLD